MIGRLDRKKTHGKTAQSKCLNNMIGRLDRKKTHGETAKPKCLTDS
jgi:hypothetical protein